MTAKVRAASSKRVEDPYSMRVNGRTAAKPRASRKLRTSCLAVGEIDEQRAFEAVERAREKRGRDRLVIRDQRADLRGQAAVAAQREADDAARALGDELGGGQPPAQAAQARRRGRRRKPRHRRRTAPANPCRRLPVW